MMEQWQWQSKADQLARLLAGDLDGAAADLEDMQATLGPGPALDGLEAHLLARRGDEPAARRIVSELGERVASGDPFGGVYLSYVEPLAQLHAALGQHDSALGLLEALMESKGHVRRLSSDPLFDPLHKHPEFRELLED